jgi:hypothetical protein
MSFKIVLFLFARDPAQLDAWGLLSLNELFGKSTVAIILNALINRKLHGNSRIDPDKRRCLDLFTRYVRHPSPRVVIIYSGDSS